MMPGMLIDLELFSSRTMLNIIKLSVLNAGKETLCLFAIVSCNICNNVFVFIFLVFNVSYLVGDLVSCCMLTCPVGKPLNKIIILIKDLSEL